MEGHRRQGAAGAGGAALGPGSLVYLPTPKSLGAATGLDPEQVPRPCAAWLTDQPASSGLGSDPRALGKRPVPEGRSTAPRGWPGPACPSSEWHPQVPHRGRHGALDTRVTPAHGTARLDAPRAAGPRWLCFWPRLRCPRRDAHDHASESETRAARPRRWPGARLRATRRRVPDARGWPRREDPRTLRGNRGRRAGTAARGASPVSALEPRPLSPVRWGIAARSSRLPCPGPGARSEVRLASHPRSCLHCPPRLGCAAPALGWPGPGPGGRD